ncbi:MAG: VCBS repeat-containing protein, partial [Acidobacteriales bacterium]|nr:VCBS repeat-containing protein [Terriglobales bacterium]
DVIVNGSYLGGDIVTAWLGNGDKRLQRRVTNVSQCCSYFVPGDFNGDGRLDAFVLTFGIPVGYTVLLGNGDGRFQQLSIQPLDSAFAPAVGDLNGDGTLDVALLANQTVTSCLARETQPSSSFLSPRSESGQPYHR